MESVATPRALPEEVERLLEVKFNGASEDMRPAVRGLLVAERIRALQARREEELRRWNIRFDAVAIGTDYYEASGVLPTRENFAALYHNDYGPDPAEIDEVFEGVDELNEAIEAEWSIRQTRRLDERRAILDEIRQKREAGELPAILFAKFGRYKSTINRHSCDRAAWIEGNISEKEILKRYAKYMIACELLPDGESVNNKFDRGAQRTSIALGINVHNPKVMGKRMHHSFVYELISANSELVDKGGVVGTEVYQKWESYLNPDGTKQYHDEVLSNADPQRLVLPEYYYDKESARIIALGYVSIEGFRRSDETRYLEQLNKQQQLVVSKSINSLPVEAKLSEIIKLDQLLIDGSEVLIKVKQHQNKYRSWEKEDFISYGHWLLRILEGAEKRLTTNNVKRAYKTGIGPSLDVIIKRFGTVQKFFEEVGFSNYTASGSMDHMTLEDYAQYVSQVRAKHGGRINRKVLRQEYQQKRIKDVPSPYHFAKKVPGGLTAILGKIGSSPNNIRVDPNLMLANGTEFTRQHGRPPHSSEIRAKNGFASVRTIQKLFGSIKDFQKMCLD